MLIMLMFLMGVCDLYAHNFTSLALGQQHDSTRVNVIIPEDMGNIDLHLTTAKPDKSRAFWGGLYT